MVRWFSSILVGDYFDDKAVSIKKADDGLYVTYNTFFGDIEKLQQIVVEKFDFFLEFAMVH